jgi:pimeloyl-ACP methyl ester carboxylesterase
MLTIARQVLPFKPILILLGMASLQGLATAERPSKDNWVDSSPHKIAYQTVNGVKLHYLDWGGKGETLLFLAGAGSNAHYADDLAPKFTDKFRVLALTRRGTGKSDWPEKGYALDTLVEDIRAFLDSLGIKRATLVGHSLGGDEATVFASKYPDRVDKIVYLDGTFDRSAAFGEKLQALMKTIDAKDPLPPIPQPTTEDRATIEALRDWFKKRGASWSNAMEASFRESQYPDGKLKPGPPMAPTAMTEIIKSATAAPPDFTKVKAPALSLVAIMRRHPGLPPNADEETRKKAMAFVDAVPNAIKRAHVDQFRKALPTAKIVEVTGDHSTFFVESEADVVREMRAFLIAKQP